MNTHKQLTQENVTTAPIKFIGRVTSMGKKKLIITVPTEFHENAIRVKGQRAIVTVDPTAYKEIMK